MVTFTLQGYTVDMNASLEGPETLSLANGARRIERWSLACTHWMGHAYPVDGTPTHLAFESQSSAMLWLSPGRAAAQARPVSFLEAARGCECHRVDRVVVASHKVLRAQGR